MSLFSNAIHALLRPFWRMTRGLTMGAQAVVIDEQDRVLLVRHGYRPGWHFPGGGVEWNESLHLALVRELYEETGIELTGPANLHGIFTNFKKFKGDHIGVFIVREWRQDKIPEPNAEIQEIGFFAIDELPEQTVQGVKNRLGEIFNNQSIASTWT